MSEQQPETTEPVVPPVEPTTETPKSENYIDPKAYEEIKADMLKYKAKVSEFETRVKQEEEKRLRETNDWKTLYERKESEAKEASEKLSKFENTLTNTAKFGAVREAALKAGIRPEAVSDLELVDFKDIVVDKAPTGRIEVRGAERAVEMLKTLKPHWFGKPLNINSSLPSTTTDGGIANEDKLLKMSLEAQKSGDYTAYAQELKKFQQAKGV
jgi:hypothetical protein